MPWSYVPWPRSVACFYQTESHWRASLIWQLASTKIFNVLVLLSRFHKRKFDVTWLTLSRASKDYWTPTFHQAKGQWTVRRCVDVCCCCVYAHISKFSVVRQDQVNLHRILCTSHTGRIHRGDFVASHALTKAIVKSYNPGHDGQKVGFIYKIYYLWESSNGLITGLSSRLWVLEESLVSYVLWIWCYEWFFVLNPVMPIYIGYWVAPHHQHRTRSFSCQIVGVIMSWIWS